MSLDGYIARPDGSVDWLYEIEGNGGDNGYSEFYGTVGSVVMGRNTYEEVLKLADEFPYADKPAFVLTRSGQPPAPHVVFLQANPLTGLSPGYNKPRKARSGL
ncbi:dihydrofolate reductase family protein [Paenibacillus rhizoplanae]